MLLMDVEYNQHNYSLRSFSVASPQLWNALPLDLRSCSNLNEFKHTLKTHLFLGKHL